MTTAILPEYGVKIHQHFVTTAAAHTTTAMPACVIGPLYYIKKDEPISAPDLSMYKSRNGVFTVATKALVDLYLPSYITVNHKVRIDAPAAMAGDYDILAFDNGTKTLTISNALIALTGDATSVSFTVYNPAAKYYLGSAMEVKYPGITFTGDTDIDPVVDPASVKVSITDKSGVHNMAAATNVISLTDTAITVTGGVASLQVPVSVDLANVTTANNVIITAPAEIAGGYKITSVNLGKEKTSITVNSDGATLPAGSFFTLTDATGVAYSFWFEVDGLPATAPTVPGTPIKVTVADTATVGDIADAFATAANSTPALIAAFNVIHTLGTAGVEVENKLEADAPNCSYAGADFTVTVNPEGVRSLTITSDSGVVIAATTGVNADVYTTGFLAGTELLTLTSGFTYKGQIKVSFRALRKDKLYDIIKVQRVTELEAECGVVNDPSNTLGFGMLMEVTGAAQGVEVCGIPIADNSMLEHQKAIDTLYTKKQCYYIVPLTQDPAIISAYGQHNIVASRPEEKWFQMGFFNRQIPKYSAIFSRGTELDAPLTGGASFGFTAAGSDVKFTDDSTGVDFSVLNIEVGNWVKFTVNDGGVTKHKFCLVKAPLPSLADPNSIVFAPVTGADGTFTFPVDLTTVQLLKYEVISDRFDADSKADKDKQAEELASWITSFSTGISISAEDTGRRRHVIMFPDLVGVTIDGTTNVVPGYFLCAAVAGMKSLLPPEQPIAETPIPGITAVYNSTDRFSTAQIRLIESAGCMVAYQPTPTAFPRFRKQITADLTSIKTMQLSTVTTVDAFAIQLSAALCNYVARVLLTPTAINTIVFFIDAYISRARSAGMIADGHIEEVGIDPQQPDRLIVKVKLTTFDPLNIIEVHLYI